MLAGNSYQRTALLQQVIHLHYMIYILIITERRPGIAPAKTSVRSGIPCYSSSAIIRFSRSDNSKTMTVACFAACS